VPQVGPHLAIPKIHFQQASLFEILAFLNRKADELRRDDRQFAVELDCDRISDLPNVTLQLSDVPIEVAVRYVAEYAGLPVVWKKDRAILKCRKAALKMSRR
jgi:hypothetical protein